MSREPPVGVVVVGGGRMGAAHVAACATVPGCAVRAVIDPDAAVRARYERMGVPSCASLEPQALEAAGLVIVASPTRTHLDVLEAVATRRVTVLLEKPCATSMAAFDRLDAIVATARGAVLVGFWRRFSPTILRMREVVASGAVGRPRLSLACQWDAVPPPLAQSPTATTGGIGLDCGVHETDTLRFLGCGALAGVHRETPSGACDAVAAGDSDQLVATGVTDQGVAAAIALSRTAGGHDEIVLKVVCERGSVEAVLSAHATLRVSSADGRHSEDVFPGDPIARALTRQLEAAVAGDVSNAASVADARAAATPWLVA